MFGSRKRWTDDEQSTCVALAVVKTGSAELILLLLASIALTCQFGDSIEREWEIISAILMRAGLET
jgi:hypothetical protein